ncbi:alkaline phytoceramidase [Propionivibrio limicola]|uniref:alkaline phytoceramidase n=1 Tax=Propionivibrio limicola TaxID=167645 RepID=UPI001291BCEA|nr:alkaline phytoceramidase [Propionivibrio limicola]
MRPAFRHLPIAVVTLLALAALWYGPIAQLPNYHAFADQRTLFGIAHFADVASNIGFALVAVVGGYALIPHTSDETLVHGWAGYRLFLAGLLLTAFGSSYYHLAPDNARLVWDRLPIALACGGLLAGVWGDVMKKSAATLAGWLALLSLWSVGWWYVTEMTGNGDLRPYLMFQALPFVLIPLWHWIYRSPTGDRLAFGVALLLYALAKIAELIDHEIATATGLLTGHTLKHLLATVAAAIIVLRLHQRRRTSKT